VAFKAPYSRPLHHPEEKASAIKITTQLHQVA